MFCLHYWYFIFIFGRMKKTKGVCVFCLNDWCKKWWHCIHHEFKWLRRALICFWIWFKSHCMILLFVHSLSSFNNETAGRDVRRFVICICVSIIVVSRACIRDDSLGLPKTLLILWHEEPNKRRKRSDNKIEKDWNGNSWSRVHAFKPVFGFFVVVYSVFIHDFDRREIWSSICVILFRVSRHEKRQDKHSKWKLCWRSALFAVQQYTLNVSSLVLFKFSFPLLCCLWIINCYFLLPEEGEYFLQNQRKHMNSWGLQSLPVWVVWSLDLMLSFIEWQVDCFVFHCFFFTFWDRGRVTLEEFMLFLELVTSFCDSLPVGRLNVLRLVFACKTKDG